MWKLWNKNQLSMPYRNERSKNRECMIWGWRTLCSQLTAVGTVHQARWLEERKEEVWEENPTNQFRFRMYRFSRPKTSGFQYKSRMIIMKWMVLFGRISRKRIEQLQAIDTVVRYDFGYLERIIITQKAENTTYKHTFVTWERGNNCITIYWLLLVCTYIQEL